MSSKPKPPAKCAAANNSARLAAAEYNKNLRLTQSGTGKGAKIYSIADSWASHYKSREETKVFAQAVGYDKKLSATPFRIPGREENSLSEDPAVKFSGADVNLSGTAAGSVSEPPRVGQCS